MKASIAELTERFPNARIAFLVASELSISADRSPALAEAIAAAEAACRASYERENAGQIPGIAAWREAYKGFGVKKTSYRSSVERLVRNVLGERELPRINSLVDSYNLISLRHIMPVGADDLDRVAGDIAFRFARDGDTFIPLGQTDPDPPKPGEVVYADEDKVLCRRWNWYQDARSPVGLETRKAVLTIQSNGAGDLEAAVEDLAGMLKRHCSATITWAIADATAPEVALT